MVAMPHLRPAQNHDCLKDPGGILHARMCTEVTVGSRATFSDIVLYPISRGVLAPPPPGGKLESIIASKPPAASCMA